MTPATRTWLRSALAAVAGLAAGLAGASLTPWRPPPALQDTKPSAATAPASRTAPPRSSNEPPPTSTTRIDRTRPLETIARLETELARVRSAWAADQVQAIATAQDTQTTADYGLLVELLEQGDADARRAVRTALAGTPPGAGAALLSAALFSGTQEPGTLDRFFESLDLLASSSSDLSGLLGRYMLRERVPLPHRIEVVARMARRTSTDQADTMVSALALADPIHRDLFSDPRDHDLLVEACKARIANRRNRSAIAGLERLGAHESIIAHAALHLARTDRPSSDLGTGALFESLRGSRYGDPRTAEIASRLSVPTTESPAPWQRWLDQNRPFVDRWR